MLKLGFKKSYLEERSSIYMEEQEGAMEDDMDITLAQALKNRKKKTTAKKRKSPAQPENLETAQLALPSSDEPSGFGNPPDIAVSEFDYSIENHFKAVDAIAKLSGHPETVDSDKAEIQRFSDSITFLREWRDFKYKPRVLKFACQHNSEEKDVVGGVTLPPFSSASVPKGDNQTRSTTSGTRSSQDFVMNVGGAVWALDWCPGDDRNSEHRVKSEFVAVAAHPPESSYHKIGAPLTGRGVIQIWCLSTVRCMKEDLPSQEKKRARRVSQKTESVKPSKPTEPLRPRGRPRKKPVDDAVEMLTEPRRTRGRPRKKSVNDSVEMIDTESQLVQPLFIEYPEGSSTLHSSDRTSDVGGDVSDDPGRVPPEDSYQEENSNILLLTAPKGNKNKTRRQKKNPFLSNGQSAIMNSLESASCSLDSMMPEKNIACDRSCDTKTSNDIIPSDVALPKMMLCLAHNGKVAWDVKWRPFSASNPGSMYRMGYLAVLLGNGALEVWEVPLPHTMKLVFPGCQERIDPRFIKLQPVFRCSMLRCGDRQSIPLTVEWSASHDMILAGCHDGVVALWKFSVTGSSTETRPLLSFSADKGPIRALAWAPLESDIEGANVIVTAGHKGFKFWDMRDPFRPLWEHAIQGVNYSLDWLSDPRCLVGSVDDGTLWLVSLVKTANDILVAGKSMTVKQGIQNHDCSSFSIWSVQASRLTGMVAYCDEEGKIHCFQLTTRSVTDTRNRLPHYLCGSLLQEEDALIVVTPSTHSPFSKRTPTMKRGSASTKDQEKRVKEHAVNGQTHNKMSLVKYGGSKGKLNDDQESTSGRGEDLQKLDGVGVSEGGIEGFEVLPPKIVAMHRVRWNLNKGSEKWLCYGGAAGLESVIEPGIMERDQ